LNKELITGHLRVQTGSPSGFPSSEKSFSLFPGVGPWLSLRVWYKHWMKHTEIVIHLHKSAAYEKTDRVIRFHLPEIRSLDMLTLMNERFLSNIKDYEDLDSQKYLWLRGGSI
jgi:hypothetical protein